MYIKLSMQIKSLPFSIPFIQYPAFAAPNLLDKQVELQITILKCHTNMGFHTKSHFTFLLFTFTILCTSSTLQFSKATRALGGDQWLEKNVMVIQSLQRAPVPPSSSSPCTYIPGRSTGHCP